MSIMQQLKLMFGFILTVFQHPIRDRHAAYSIFTQQNITLLSLHHDEGEISAPCSGNTFQMATDFELSIKYTFSMNYIFGLH